MYTLSFILLAFQLVYCCVLVVLLLYILINSKRMELFSIITMNSIPVPEPLPHKSKPLKTNGSSWKITYHFDTTQTPDPTTGLPPLSGIEIEGSEKQSKTAQESNDTVHSSNSSSKREVSGQTIQRESGTETRKDSKVATGTDDGIRNGLSIGIPLLFIIIALSYYAKRQNISK